MEIPERLLAGLPESIKTKITKNEELSSSDCRIARAYIEKIIVHPEFICDYPKQIISVLELYMTIGAIVPKNAFEHLKSLDCNESFVEKINSYSKISDFYQIHFDTLPRNGTNSTFLSFCHINADRGFRRWNLYAENYGKFIKTIKRWCELEASHLRSECHYELYLDKNHIGTIKHSRFFEANHSSEMMSFIVDFFPPPISLSLFFSLIGDDDVSLKPFTLECRVYGESRHNSVLVLPVNPQMRLKMLTKTIIDISSRVINAIRFQDAVTCDIDAQIVLNDIVIGVIEIDTGELSITNKGRVLLAEYSGVDIEPDQVDILTSTKVKKMTFFQRLKFLFWG